LRAALPIAEHQPNLHQAITMVCSILFAERIAAVGQARNELFRHVAPGGKLPLRRTPALTDSFKGAVENGFVTLSQLAGPPVLPGSRLNTAKRLRASFVGRSPPDRPSR
jgi:hypothetical protein